MVLMPLLSRLLTLLVILTMPLFLARLTLIPIKSLRDRKSGSAGMPRPISYAVFCLKKKSLRRDRCIRPRRTGLRCAWPCRTPSPPCARSRTGAGIRAMRQRQARRRRARAQRAEWHPAHARARSPRSARRAGATARAASRTGTCPGSSATASRSGGRSRPRDRRARRELLRARRSSPSRRAMRGGERLARNGDQRVGLRRAFDERHHRAVAEVDVHPVAPPGERAPVRDAAREDAGAEAEQGEQLTLHPPPFSGGAASLEAAPRRRRAGSS